MVEGRVGVTLLPEMTLHGGILKGTRLVARPLAAPAPSRIVALTARRTSPRLPDVTLLADFIVEYHRGAVRPGIPTPRRQAPRA
jgi:LysR family hydrogen peroxide-inducible transcriptional activator